MGEVLNAKDRTKKWYSLYYNSGPFLVQQVIVKFRRINPIVTHRFGLFEYVEFIEAASDFMSGESYLLYDSMAYRADLEFDEKKIPNGGNLNFILRSALVQNEDFYEVFSIDDLFPT